MMLGVSLWESRLTWKMFATAFLHLATKDWIISLLKDLSLLSLVFPLRVRLRCRREAQRRVWDLHLSELSWEPLDVSDPCRWRRVASLWSALKLWRALTAAESNHLGTNAACLPSNRLCPTWWCAEGGGSAPCETPVWSPAWREPPFFCSATKTAIWLL